MKRKAEIENPQPLVLYTLLDEQRVSDSLRVFV